MKERILIADDHYVVRAGTALVLETAFPGLEIDFAENYEQVKKADHPAIRPSYSGY